MEALAKAKRFRVARISLSNVSAGRRSAGPGAEKGRGRDAKQRNASEPNGDPSDIMLWGE
jgi:hypothetical protein